MPKAAAAIAILTSSDFLALSDGHCGKPGGRVVRAKPQRRQYLNELLFVLRPFTLRSGWGAETSAMLLHQGRLHDPLQVAFRL